MRRNISISSKIAPLLNPSERRPWSPKQEMSQKYYEDTVNSKLENKHAVERVSELVRVRLVECGWRDQVRLACRKLSEENDRYSSLDELVAVVTPSARAMVPDSVKRELLHELELILTNIDKLPQKKSN